MNKIISITGLLLLFSLSIQVSSAGVYADGIDDGVASPMGIAVQPLGIHNNTSIYDANGNYQGKAR